MEQEEDAVVTELIKAGHSRVDAFRIFYERKLKKNEVK
jgi:hypothetical protein